MRGRGRAALPARSGRTVLQVAAIGLLAFFVGYLVTAFIFFGGLRGDDIVTVPDLRWRPEAESRRLAERANLELDVGASLENPQVPEGHVLAQSPLPGSEVSPGSAVRVTLSAGAARHAVPNVSAFGGEQARQFLARSGFDVVVEERPDPQPRGRLLETLPAPGTIVQMPATVRLVVSAGPPRAPVPGVLGMTEREARETLEVAGFTVSEISYNPFSIRPTGTVVEQAPAASDSLRVGAGVSITVSGEDPWDL